ncbi:MAG: TMEM165/GDT1 family protein [Rhodospirillaceae bacterium]|jgi:Ca2+/H+ antiporter, TMEM165/GDT1 family|nr:TMEM165/GDT1 family protein [Rhodospirillaceae bacterium]MBT3491697.1 TMEM165/GDT1 family protein [Rhodospirillaceae bacterium]MBT3783247.1 TMEM165/GDT1 family protein [Rhodospirillaceae bacterium]MBT3978243.1 TMEM165/GDT1 family protein [Rhodospirillaceae bacterium]MBT4168944.1 TMEM165/GDT1 family protein [Rhodospirillaceae bacterium]
MTIIWEPMGVSLALITLAEIGDKSQLVCMVLAARHGRARPVLFGAVAAFAVLNGAAVVFGAALAAWLPQTWVLGAMAVLFAAFGVHALLQSADSGDDDVELKLSSHGLFMTAFVMIFLAEFGDKTQIAVAGLAGIYPALAVWLGATLALALTSAAGALAGRAVLRRLPLIWLHRLSGVLFLGLAVLAVWRLWAMV